MDLKNLQNIQEINIYLENKFMLKYIALDREN